MEFDKVIRERQSTRKFKEEKVSDELINKILEAGVIAPTAKNIQPEIIYVVKSEEGLKKMDDVSPCRYKAPLCMIVCTKRDEAYKNGEHDTYQIDASIIATHMILEATNLGVDSVWVELFDKQKFKDAFNLEENLEPIVMLPLGYKTDDYPGSPNHNKRKDLSEVVREV